MTERVLIFSPNWLGDAVMALPALRDVRRGLPNATIDVAARPAIAPLFTLVPDVGHVQLLGNASASVARLREGRYDTALLFTNSFNTARVAWSAGIAERWGYRTDFRSLLLTKGITPAKRVHQAEYYRHLVRECGFASDSSTPRLEISADQRAAGHALLAGEGWETGSPILAVAPGAAFGGAKRWPATSFAALIDGLAKDGVRVVVIGTAADRQAAVEVLAAIRRSVTPIDLVGRTDLPTLAGILVHCRALVTNDSGAMHLAAALGVAVTAMFGPTRERETHPLGDAGHTVMTNPVWCRPCMLRECPLTHRCMTGISVDAVLSATRPRL